MLYQGLTILGSDAKKSQQSPTTPTTHPPLPHYDGRRTDNSGLLEAIDRADHKISEALDLVTRSRATPLDLRHLIATDLLSQLVSLNTNGWERA